MHAHIIFAHPNDDTSYNASLRNITAEVFDEANVPYEATSLYQHSDMLTTYFGEEQSPAQQAFIKNEQEKILHSHLTIVQFPLYWFSFPAIFKNYFDLVFAQGFAYPGIFSESPLHDGRKVLLSITTQSTAEDFTEQGRNGDIQSTLHSMELAFRFVGYEILPSFMHYAVANMSEEQIKNDMNAYRTVLQRLF